MLIAIVVLAFGYFGYAKWLEKTWGIDLKRPTPAVSKNDGKDFSPASRWTVFAHQFTSITGAGPVTGPIIAAMFGWLPALLWMLVGGVFFGAVQDFTALSASVKNGGRSIGMIVCGVAGVCIQNPTINMPAYVGFTVKNLDLFPILFVTVACGAVSGFHSLVSSGTSSKMVASEGDMRLVGYGSMCVEVVLGVVSLIVVCAAANNGVLPAGTPFQTFSHSVASFLTTIFGVPQQIAACILTMCVSALALTSVDAVARIGRMSLQELFMPSEGEEKNAVQKVFTNTVFSTVLTLLGGYALCIAGYMSVWPLFGSANQLLSALVLTGLAVFLKSTGRKGWMLYGPMAIMFVVTMTALIEQIIRIFGAISAGNFVLMVHGLQLVVAVALIVLALLVVYHCVLKLKDAAPVIKRD